MKRIIFIALLFIILSTMPVLAQDTVRSSNTPCYFLNQVSPTAFIIGNDTVACGKDGTSGAGFEYVLPENEETTIYGIALTAERPKNDDSAGYTVYMYIVGDSNRLVCVDSVTKYSVATQFMYEGYTDPGIDIYPSGLYGRSVVPCYEYYFNQPHVITNEEIYLGARWDYNFMPRSSMYLGTDHCFCHSVIYLDCDTLRYAGGPNSVGHNSPLWGGVMPIIRPRCTSCPVVHEVVFPSIDNGTAVVVWDTSAGQQDWQLCYGPQGFTPDSALAITTTVPTDTLTGLSDTMQYDVYVRARCECCPNDEWTPWAGPFTLRLSWACIGEAAAPEVTLSPNPTTGKLTVSCEAEITAVEMYDMQGRVVDGQWSVASGQRVVLDLSALPCGTYVVVVTTPQGRATRTVERR